MRFGPSEVQLALRDAVRGLLNEHADAARAAYDGRVQEARRLWERMVRELELTAVGVPEHFGGTGASFADLAVVAEELGRALAPVPFFSSVVLATRLLLESGDAEVWLPALVSGASIGTAALVEESGDWSFTGLTTTAHLGASGWRLNGTKHFVTDAATADLLLVLAQAPQGPTLFAVYAEDLAENRLQEALDATRSLGTVILHDSPGVPVGSPGEALPVVERALRSAAIALACEQVGGAGRCLDMAVGYAGVREQFDRPIGSFQAVKHMLADVLVDNESASAVVAYGAWAADHPQGETAALASLCKAFASDAYIAAAKTNVQVHGGIGFTWEHDAHLHLRRAVSTRAFLGSPETHRELIAAHVLDSPRGDDR
jgi:alkylation response protein AidB-like acyl-CoA dehydrogenase